LWETALEIKVQTRTTAKTRQNCVNKKDFTGILYLKIQPTSFDFYMDELKILCKSCG